MFIRLGAQAPITTLQDCVAQDNILSDRYRTCKMTVTSIAILSLKKDDRGEDSNTTAVALIQGRVPDILASPGAQRCYWGQAVESEDLYYLIVDWATLQHHVDFVKNRYGSVV